MEISFSSQEEEDDGYQDCELQQAPPPPTAVACTFIPASVTTEICSPSPTQSSNDAASAVTSAASKGKRKGILEQLQGILESLSLPPPCSSSTADQRQQQMHIHMLDACILCGRIMLPELDRRYKDLGELATLIKERCCPTPYIFCSILSEEAQMLQMPSSTRRKRVCCCTACINWIRRLSSARSAKSKPKIPIPMDNLLLFLQCPGTPCCQCFLFLRRLLTRFCTHLTRFLFLHAQAQPKPSQTADLCSA